MDSMPTAPCNDQDLQKIKEEWLDYLHCEQSRSAATLRSYESDWKNFLVFLESYLGETPNLHHFLSLEPRTWRAWLSHQKNQNLSARTLARRLAALKNFFRFLIRRDGLVDHAIFSARSPRLTLSLPRPTSFSTILKMVETCPLLPGEPWVHKRDQALIILLYSVGLRIQEALNLRVKDVEPLSDFLSIQGKGAKMRQVPFLPLVYEKIHEYIQSCPFAFSPKMPVFLGQKGGPLLASVFETRIRAIRQLLNLPSTVTPHTLRHSCATHLMSESEDLRGIQELLGHSSLSSTQVYVNLENQTLQTLYERTHPRAKKNKQP
jgi:integrase/recombinase XerC